MRATATSRLLRLRLCLALTLLALLLASAGFAATTRIRYLSSASVYLDAGSRAGLAEGMRVQVERDGRVIAELVVDFVAQNSASCRVLSKTEDLRPGDAVTFTPEVSPPSAAAAPVEATPPSLWSRMGSAHGRLSFLYIRSEDAAGTYTNPLLSAALGWRGEERSELAVRFRGDRPANDIPGIGARRDARLYEASLRYRSRKLRFEIEAGRLLPERLELLGAMDGGGLHWRPRSTWRVGVAVGTGAEFSSIGFAANGLKAGGFLETEDDGGLWRATLSGGWIDDPDVTRRQYLQLRGDARPHRLLRLYENAEVDFSPAWKESLGASAVELTTLSSGVQVWLHRHMDVSLGYESRRPLLDPSQRQLLPLPELPSRDLLHSLRAAARARLTPRWTLRVGGDVRRSTKATSDMHSLDAWLFGTRLGPLSLSLHGSFYDSRQAHGEILDARVSFEAGRRTRLDLGAGSNGTQTNADIAGGSEPKVRWDWMRMAANHVLGRGLWIDAAGEWRSNGQGNELFLHLAQQF